MKFEYKILLAFTALVAGLNGAKAHSQTGNHHFRIWSSDYDLRAPALHSFVLNETQYISSINFEAVSQVGATLDILVNNKLKGSTPVSSLESQYMLTIDESSNSIEFQNRAGSDIRIKNVEITTNRSPAQVATTSETTTDDEEMDTDPANVTVKDIIWIRDLSKKFNKGMTGTELEKLWTPVWEAASDVISDLNGGWNWGGAHTRPDIDKLIAELKKVKPKLKHALNYQGEMPETAQKLLDKLENMMKKIQ